MSSTGVSRIAGIDPFTSSKAPCTVATTANITLSGAQTVDGVAVAETTPKTRVLVKDQTDQTENGIYDVYDTSWVRSDDFNGTRDATKGTMINIQSGTFWTGVTFRLTTTGTVVFGTSSITFESANPANSTTVIGKATLDTYAKLMAINTGQYSNGDIIYLAGSGIAGSFRLVNSVAHGITSTTGVQIRINDDWYAQRVYDGSINVKWFEAKGDASTNDTSAILSAIIANRGASYTILDTIGGSNITAYDNGPIYFPPGTYVCSFDSIQLSQDMNVQFIGAGFRGTTNYRKGKTILLFSGTSSGYAIQQYRNGARNFTVRNMDICYENSNFTGDLVDQLDSPGLTIEDAYIGYYGSSGSVKTAQSCIRSTYDEFLECNRVTFDGADVFWYSDDVRTALGNTFGGSNTTFKDCTFYDCGDTVMKHSGARTRTAVDLISCIWNPINSAYTRGIDFNNVDGLNIVGGNFAPSTSFGATEWVKLANCSGTIQGVSFGDLAKAGQLGGQITLSGCNHFTTDGWTLDSGVITTHSNEFSTGTNGYIVSSPSDTLCINLGPDLFKSSVTNSYNITDSANLSGTINYSGDTDNSTNGFSNDSGRITISNIDKKQITITDVSYTILKKNTGREHVFAGAANQTCTVPVSIPGTDFTIRKVSSFTLDIDRSSTNNFYTGDTAVKTAIDIANTDIGGTVKLRAYATVGYFAEVQGTVTYT